MSSRQGAVGVDRSSGEQLTLFGPEPPPRPDKGPQEPMSDFEWALHSTGMRYLIKGIDTHDGVHLVILNYHVGDRRTGVWLKDELGYVHYRQVWWWDRRYGQWRRR